MPLHALACGSEITRRPSRDCESQEPLVLLQRRVRTSGAQTACDGAILPRVGKRILRGSAKHRQMGAPTQYRMTRMTTSRRPAAASARAGPPARLDMT